MSATDVVTVGQALPRIRSVSFNDGYEVAVTWDAATRDGRTDAVDLAPLIFRLKFYAPLRDDRRLMATVRAIDEGTAIAWGDGDVDMAATSVLDLAEESMTAADFSEFMTRHGFTFDRIAAELGISKRLAGYYAAGRSVPRYIALACALMDLQLQRKPVAPALDRRAVSHGAERLPSDRDARVPFGTLERRGRDDVAREMLDPVKGTRERADRVQGGVDRLAVGTGHEP